MKKELIKSSTSKKQESTKTKIIKDNIILAPKDFSWWIPTLVFIITTILFFWDNIFGNMFFWEDFVEQYLPWQTFAAREFAKGILPFWNSYTFNGMPFIADLQVGFFYPFNRLLGLFLNSDGVLPATAIQIIIILHFFIAQISMYSLSRFWKISSLGSMISAVSYSFSFILVCHAIHPMIVYMLSWLPLVVMFFLKGITKFEIKYSIIAGLILGISMLAGHPQTTLYEVFLLGIIAIWYLIAGLLKKELNSKQIIQFILYSLISIAIAVGIFCIQYLPASELAKFAERREATYQYASEGSLQFKQIFTTTIPKIYGFIDGSGSNTIPYHLEKAPYYFYWDTGFYFGIIALFLGLLGAFNRFRTKEVAMLIAIGLFGFIYALGDNGFLFGIFYNLPLFGTFRIPSRILFYVVISMTVLAGFGFDELWKRENKTKNNKTIIYSMIFPIFTALGVATGFLLNILNTPEDLQSKIQSFGSYTLVFLIVLFVLAWLTNRASIKPLIAGIAIFILAYIDLFMAGESFNKSKENPVSRYEMNKELKNILSPHIPNDIYRVAMRMYKPSYMALQRNQGLVDNIMLVEGYNPLILEKVKPPMYSTKEVYDLLNVKYEIALDSVNRRPYFKERDSYYPRAWAVDEAVVLNNSSDIKTQIQKESIDFKKIVLLEEKPEIKLSNKNDSLKYDLHCKNYQNNLIEYMINTNKNTMVVFSEIWYPAWTVYIDNIPSKLYQANYCFRAVAVPEGQHTITMKYESASFAQGALITIITLSISLILLVILFIFKSKIRI